jgi:hypothetical protein
VRRYGRRRSGALLLLGAMLVSCSSSGSEQSATTSTTTDSSDAETDAAAPTSTTLHEQPDAETTTPPEADATTTTTTTTEPVAPDPHLAVPDGAVVETEAISGQGVRPRLEWSPAEGAAGYTVVVFDQAGSPYWAAITTDTEIYVGGARQIPDGVDGPEIADGYSWVVYADDADGTPIGSSALMPLGP